MPFLTLRNMHIEFAKKKLVLRTYTIAEALATTRRVKLINKKDFAKTIFDKDVGAFLIHVNSLTIR